jgi:hypothetical protein
MEMVLRGLQWKTCLIYIDDIIVFGNSFENTLENFRTVLHRLRWANLKLKVSKCELFKKEVIFLGHQVGRLGVSADPAKIEVMKSWPRPQTIVNVQSFLGTVGYYQKFIPNYGKNAAPLFLFNRKNAEFYWEEEQETAFQTLKKLMCEAPILAYPRQTGLLILDTDASDDGVGGVLSQIQDGEEKVLYYFSQTMNKHQRQYCATKRELLAVIVGLKKCRHYLYGTHFLIRTDHASLVWLVNFKDPEGMIARWISQLQEYDYRIEHRKGTLHGNADGLSRRHVHRTCKRTDCPDCSIAIKCIRSLKDTKAPGKTADLARAIVVDYTSHPDIGMPTVVPCECLQALLAPGRPRVDNEQPTELGTDSVRDTENDEEEYSSLTLNPGRTASVLVNNQPASVNIRAPETLEHDDQGNDSTGGLRRNPHSP